MFKRFRQFQYVFVGLVYISTIIFVFYSFDHNTKPAIASSVVTIQPSSVDGKDSTITPFNNMHEFNFGDQNDLYGGIVRMSQHGLLVEFDISTFLASTAVISSADLSLYFPTGIYAENSADLSIHRVDEAWDEATVNWANQPGFNTTPEDTVTIGDSSAPGWYSFDITDLVQGWLDGDHPNYGVIIDFIEAIGSTDAKTFYSSDYTIDETLRPKLVIKYEEGAAPVSAYHHECSNNMCTTVSGVGEDECQNNSQCLVEVSTLTEEDSSSQAVTILPATGVDRDRLFATWFLLPWLKMIVKTF